MLPTKNQPVKAAQDSPSSIQRMMPLLSRQERRLTLLGQVLDQEQRAREVVAFVDAELRTLFSRLEKISRQPPSVYIEAGSAGVATYGNSYGYDGKSRMSSWGEVLQRAKGRNIAANAVSNMAPLNPEFLLKSDPEIIIITGACWSAYPDTMRMGYLAEPGDCRKRLAGFLERPGWHNLQAVKNKRVYSLFHGFCMHPFAFAAVQQCAKWFYPEEFKALDPEERLKEFHKRSMPVEYSGTWMLTLEDGE